MLLYLGSFYLLLGIAFLLLPLIYIKIGRPRDLFIAGLYLVIGTILITKNNTYDNLFYLLLILISLLFSFHIWEIFIFRWNFLTEKEKNKSRSIEELKANVFKFSKALSLVFINFSDTKNILSSDMENKNSTKKKWVRNDKNDSILTSDKNKLITFEMEKKSTNQSGKDIIEEKKI